MNGTQSLITNKKNPVHEDEISLIDLFILLSKNKKLFFLIVGMSTLLSLMVALSQENIYKYSTTIEVGSIHTFTNDGVGTILVDTPQTVVEKLNHAYIPSAISDFIKDGSRVKFTSDNINASRIKKSQLVMLNSIGRLDDEAVHINIIHLIMKKLQADHAKLYEVIYSKVDSELTRKTLELNSLLNPNTLAIKKSYIEKKIKLKENKVKKINDDFRLLKNEKNRIDVLKKLLKKELVKLSKDITNALIQRRDAVKNLANESKAMTMLMIDNEVRNHRARFLDLEERLYITLENDRELLENKINKNRRSLNLQKKDMDTVKNKLIKVTLEHNAEIVKHKKLLVEYNIRKKNMSNTHAVVPTYRSYEPVGKRKRTIVMIGIIFGFIFAIMLVFIKEFINKMKEVENTV